MIEELGVAFARLRAMITGKVSRAEIRAEMQKASTKAGVDLEMAKLASPEMLLSLIAAGGQLNPSRCWMTAEILLLDALDCEAAGDIVGAEASYEKALRLFQLLEPAGAFLVGWPEARERVVEIDAALRRLNPKRI